MTGADPHGPLSPHRPGRHGGSEASGGPPGAPAHGGARAVVTFTGMLRRAGLDTATSSVVGFAHALEVTGFARERDVYWAARATLVRRPEDLPVFDTAFSAFWRSLGAGAPGEEDPDEPPPERIAPGSAAPDALAPAPGAGPRALGPRPLAAQEQTSEETGDEDPGVGERVVTLRYSPTETLATKDFARLSASELEEVQRLMARLRWEGPRRVTRRRRRTRHPSAALDLRSTVRAMTRTGGEPLVRRWLEPVTRPRRVVFVCDVSGSMAPYARMLLRFLFTVVAARGDVEAFTIGTRLTRVTRALHGHDPDAALASVARAVPDWSGGTRIGAALGELNQRWAGRGLMRGAVVVILSDGWDCGQPELLGAEMARLKRLSHRIVWVNPLRATPGYEPLVRGMAAALPYVDQFVDGHSVASLEALVDVLARADGCPERVGAA